MKKIISISIFILAAFSSKAQSTVEQTGTTPISIFKEKKIDETIFTICEKMPEFPGGEEQMRKFISDNLRYPEDAKKKNIEGRVFLKFVVDKEGEICNITCIRGIYPSLDNAAMQVIALMPKWKPGTTKGESVNVWYTLPIVFQLK